MWRLELRAWATRLLPSLAPARVTVADRTGALLVQATLTPVADASYLVGRRGAAGSLQWSFHLPRELLRALSKMFL